RSIFAVAFSPDGKQVVSCGFDGAVRLWDVETGKELRRHEDHTEVVCSLAFSPDGKTILSGGGGTFDAARDQWRAAKDNDLRLWGSDSRAELRRFKGPPSTVLGVAYSPDGRQAVSGSYDSTLRWWDVATGQELKRKTAKAGLRSVAVSPDGKYVLAGGGSHYS